MKIFIGMLYSGLVGNLYYKKNGTLRNVLMKFQILETLAKSHLEEGNTEILVGPLRGREYF